MQVEEGGKKEEFYSQPFNVMGMNGLSPELLHGAQAPSREKYDKLEIYTKSTVRWHWVNIVQ